MHASHRFIWVGGGPAAKASNALYVLVLEEMCLQCLFETPGSGGWVPEIMGQVVPDIRLTTENTQQPKVLQCYCSIISWCWLAEWSHWWLVTFNVELQKMLCIFVFSHKQHQSFSLFSCTAVVSHINVFSDYFCFCRFSLQVYNFLQILRRLRSVLMKRKEVELQKHVVVIDTELSWSKVAQSWTCVVDAVLVKRFSAHICCVFTC